MIEFKERTIKVTIDDSVCPGCASKACVTACGRFGRGVLKLKDGRPAILISPAELARGGTECLACEYECWFRGLSAIKIEIPMPELEDFKRSLLTAKG